jgi:hypothetical protein
MWKQEMVITKKVDGGVVIAAAKPNYKSKPGYPSVPLFTACDALWMTMCEVAGDGTGYNELVGQLYGVLCQVASLAEQVDAVFEKEVRLRREINEDCHRELI